ncbi:hypothetical protein PspLS_00195 [Pyricularia sp. CBS 133598]|nr:hypothetical protein PspLS_00195 [Pyricularia sp. CBS 133598]
MHAFSLFLLIAPVAVFGNNITFGRGATGGLCCDRGAPDPSLTCKNMTLNSYGCTENERNSKDQGGCDNLFNWPVGRDVRAFVPGSVVTHPQVKTFDLEIGFIGCAP